MLLGLLRRLLARADAPAPPAGVPDPGKLRERLHPLLAAGRVSDAIVQLAPLLGAEASSRASRNLVEFSVRAVAGLAQQDAWRAEIAYLAGSVLATQGDEDGALACARLAWGEDGAARAYRRFRRGDDLYEHCRASGLPAIALDGLPVTRMDGLPAPQPERPRSFLCRIDGAQVIGESFLPVSADGLVFTERCIDTPAKLERFEGLAWLDLVRMSSDAALWAADGPVDEHEGEYVLLGNHENIGHWLLYYLSRLRALEHAPRLASARIVVGESLKPLHVDCLRRAGIDASRLLRIPKGRYARFERLWVPSLLCGVSGDGVIYWAPGTLADLRRRLGVDPPRGGGSRRVFLTRRGARWRRLLNEDAILDALAPLGFKAVDAGALDLDAQVALAAEAGAIVGGFGAGMNFHLFAAEGVPLVQLQPGERVRMDQHRPLARELGQPFFAVVGTERNRQGDPLKSDFEVDPARVVEAVRAALGA